MLLVALSWLSQDGGADRPDYSREQPVCDGQRRIVDQAKARGNAWDTGEVPGHLRVEPNSTIAEEVKAKVVPRSYGGQAC